MHLITKKDLIRSTPARWEATYRKLNFPQHHATADKLNALNLGLSTEKNITDIIGNSSWTRISCHECGSDVDVAVELGQERDYESSTETVCLSCLNKAIKLIHNS